MNKLVVQFRENTIDVGPEGTGWFKALVIIGDEPSMWLVSNVSFTKSNISKVCQDIAKQLTEEESNTS